MASESKSSPPPPGSQIKQRDHGIRIFTYPKVIFIFPTLVVALICGIGMKLVGDDLHDTYKAAKAAQASGHVATNPPAQGQPAQAQGQPAQGQPAQAEPLSDVDLKHRRFLTPANLLGVLFLGVFAFNLLIMAIDFPRFTVVAGLLLVLLLLFFLLWIAAYFDTDLMRPARHILGNIHTVANAGFYFMIALVLIGIYSIIYVTRYLDYWEIMPNEILHHHGPLSDLERYPTLNLKFDKEIPDVFEYLFLGAGRLVLHVTEERKAIVLDNVLFINAKEEALKRLMSRLEVRVTTDQEIAEP